MRKLTFARPKRKQQTILYNVPKHENSFISAND